MNLYGYHGRWLMVDLGITFADDSVPGIDIVMPDPTFISDRRDALDGIVLTHAHEDHIGAVCYLWPLLRCPVWATPFTARLLRRKLEEQGILNEVPLIETVLGGEFTVGPFRVKYISITHSIPESNALVIETEADRVFHTGDWKLDPHPLIGDAPNVNLLRELGDKQVLAMVCDSTNAMTDGRSGSELEVRQCLLDMCKDLKGRIAITSFASNIARIETVGQVANISGRHLVVVGRSLWRAIEVARDTGYLKTLGAVLEAEDGAYLPPDKVMYLCTGCQGESRGALTRIARNEHPDVVLEVGDSVIFSSKIIPGNEIKISNVKNYLVRNGVKIIDDGTNMVHVSGHPCREELRDMYGWIRPTISVPVHGEHRHILAHAMLAETLKVPHRVVAQNGRVVKLTNSGPEVVGDVQSGRWLLDGGILVSSNDGAVRARRKMMFNGCIVVTLVLNDRGRLCASPLISAMGIPKGDGSVGWENLGSQVLNETINELPSKTLSDDSRLENFVRRTINRLLRANLGRRPPVNIHIVRI